MLRFICFFRVHKTLNCAYWLLIWKQKFESSNILQNYIRAYQIWQRYLFWLVFHCWFCRRWININHWLAICSVRCVFMPVFGLFCVGGRFQQHYWQNKCKNILTGLCCLVSSYLGNLSKNSHPMFCPLSGPHPWLYLPTNHTRKMLFC